ncbi:IS21 family transposase, partial [Schinkia azotoformans]|nr:IS21 family transposase [Schinkia azotoformans]
MIKNRQYTRDRSKGIQAYKETVIRQFENQEKAEQFIHEVGCRYPRYIRDQLQVIQYAITHFRSDINEALDVCIKDQLWSGNDLRDITQHFARLKEKETPKVPTMQKSKTINPAIKATA